MIDCPNTEMRDQLPDLANESLAPEARLLVIAHIEACAACAAEIEMIRSVRRVVIDATPRVNVAAIVSALPHRGGPVTDRGVVPIQSARSLRSRSVGSWRIAAAITVLAAGIGSYSVLRDDSPLRSLDSTQLVAAVADTSAGLALTGALADLSDAELTALAKDIDGIEALPSTEVETTSSGVNVPALIPDSISRDLEVK